MSDVRTFHAATMQGALDLVRQELGPDAVILHTRTVLQPRWLPWSRSRELVEVTAGLGIPVRTPPVRPNATRPVSSEQAPPQSPAAAYAAARTTTPATTAPPTRSRSRIDPGPPELVKPQPQPVPPQPVKAQPMAATAVRTQTVKVAAPSSRPEPVRPAASVTETVAAPVVTGEDLSPDKVAQQLATLRFAVEQIQQRLTPEPNEITGDLFPLFSRLLDADVNEELARLLVANVARQAIPGALTTHDPVPLALLGQIEARFKCRGAIEIPTGRRKVIALIGPTGVGKTTTIAKLAANYRLRAGLKVGFVTVDTYRIAAVEQLRTYADIIDLPMQVVSSPGDMRRALDELQGLDVVLVDTAGRSPRDEVQLQELQQLLAEAQPDEIQLVLSVAASAKTLQQTVTRFAQVEPTGMILTKLDEALTLGHLLTGLKDCPFPISYLTTGQNVPDDIEPAQAMRLARWLLCPDSLRPEPAVSAHFPFITEITVGG